MENIKFGLYTLGDYVEDIATGIKISEQQRLEEIINAAKLAEEYGFDFYALGESHQEHFISQAHAVILSAIARETSTIRLSSSATMVSTSDPVRIYENFTTLDLLSNGRVEIIAGRASRIGLFSLLGYSIRNYEELFEEKFELLLKLFREDKITWEGKFRAPLNDQVLYPKPLQKDFPIWRAVGGNKSSAYLAAQQGVPMSLAVLAGSLIHFNDTIDAYRKMFHHYHPDLKPRVGIAALMYVGKTDKEAYNTFYKYLNNGFRKSNGSGFSDAAYSSALDINNGILVGSKETIINKLVKQFQMFKHERHFFQIDLGGMPFTEIERMIKVIGTEIIPEVKRSLSI